MLPGIRFFPVLLSLVLLIFRAGAGDLVFGIYNFPVYGFTAEEAAGFPADGQADAAAVLKKRGFDMPEGSSAFFEAASARIFLRSTQRDLNHIRRVARESSLSGGTIDHGPLQVRLTAICYAIPLSAVTADFGPLSSLASLPADKLTVVDQSSLLCRAGQRAMTQSKNDQVTILASDAETEAEIPAEVERNFECECTVSDNMEVLDVNVAWEIRTPKLAAVGRAGLFKIANQIVFQNGETWRQELGVTDEREPRLVILSLQAELPKAPPSPEEETEKPTAAPEK